MNSMRIGNLLLTAYYICSASSLFGQMTDDSDTSEVRPPSVSSVTPLTACPGDNIVVRGENLAHITDVEFLRYGEVSSTPIRAEVRLVDDSTLQVMAPVEAYLKNQSVALIFKSDDNVLVTVPAVHTEINVTGVQRRINGKFLTVRRGGSFRSLGGFYNYLLLENGGRFLEGSGKSIFALDGSLVDFQDKGDGNRVYYEPNAKIIRPERDTNNIFIPAEKIIPVVVDEPFRYEFDRRNVWKKQLSTDGIDSLAFSPNSRVLVAGTTSGDVLVASAGSGAVVHSLSGHQGVVTGVLMLDDGQTILSSGVDGTLRWWNGKLGELLAEVQAHESGVRGMKLAADGRHLLVGTLNGGLQLWDVAKRVKIRDIGAEERSLVSLDITSDGKRGVSAEATGKVMIWDCEKEDDAGTLLFHADKPVAAVEISPGDKTVDVYYGRKIENWDLHEKRKLADFSSVVSGASAVAASLDGHWKVRGTAHGSVAIWDAWLERDVRYYQGHAGNALTSIACSPSGQHIATADAAGWVHLLEAPNHNFGGAMDRDD